MRPRPATEPRATPTRRTEPPHRTKTSRPASAAPHGHVLAGRRTAVHTQQRSRAGSHRALCFRGSFVPAAGTGPQFRGARLRRCPSSHLRSSASGCSSRGTSAPTSTTNVYQAFLHGVAAHLELRSYGRPAIFAPGDAGQRGEPGLRCVSAADRLWDLGVRVVGTPFCLSHAVHL